MFQSQDERRLQPRQRTLKKARIIFNDRRSTIDCTVRNLSPTGALLLLPSFIGIPENFDLYVGDEAASRPARVAWKRDGKMGVKFG